MCKHLARERELEMYRSSKIFYASNLESKCPQANTLNSNQNENLIVRIESKFFEGCLFRDDVEDYLLQHSTRIESHSNVNSLKLCISICLVRNRYVVFNLILENCICLENESDKNKLVNELMGKFDCLKYSKKNGNENIYEVHRTGMIGYFHKVYIKLLFVHFKMNINMRSSK
jgi:hypothetical protein